MIKRGVLAGVGAKPLTSDGDALFLKLVLNSSNFNRVSLL